MLLMQLAHVNTMMREARLLEGVLLEKPTKVLLLSIVSQLLE